MAMRSDRVELKGSTRAAMPGGRDSGPTDPNQQIEVTVLLRRGSKPGEFPAAAEMGAQLPSKRKYLSREEFARAHGASAADLEKIRAFATQYSLKVVSENPASRMVKLSGTAKAFNEAFGANLRRYEHPSGSYRCRTGALTIPTELESIVEGVFSLDNRPQAKAHFRLRKDDSRVRPLAMAVSYSPLQVAKAYGFPQGVSGAGQCIGVIELGGGYHSSDLDSFFGALAFPLQR
jgi:kumamolisin